MNPAVVVDLVAARAEHAAGCAALAAAERRRSRINRAMELVRDAGERLCDRLGDLEEAIAELEILVQSQVGRS